MHSLKWSKALLVASFGVLLLTACQTDDGANFLVQDFAGYGHNYKDVDVFRLTPGDSQDKVRSIIEAKYEVVRKTEVNGYQLETWKYEQYQARLGPDVHLGTYFVFFVDGEFVDWNNNGEVGYIYARLDRARPGNSARSTAKQTGTGTGFLINFAGHVLTNEHVVDGCNSINVVRDGVRYTAELIGSDANNDLAVLKSQISAGRPIALSEQALPTLGANVTVMGFPLHGLVSTSMTVTTGIVSAQTGLGNNAAQLQISAAINPGNSGGPVIDDRGRAVGVVVSKLNAIAAAEITGDVAQSVNFAVKASIARLFLASQGIPLNALPNEQRMNVENLVTSYRDAVVVVECKS